MSVPVSSSVLPWTLTMPAGSLQQYLFTFTYLNASGFEVPYPIDSSHWEYVVRTSATDLSTPLISLTTTSSANGVLVVTATASQSTVLLEMYPPATVDLSPGVLAHSLWMQPNNSTSAFTWFTGELIIEGNPQP